jgi:hypothetical protein
MGDRLVVDLEGLTALGAVLGDICGQLDSAKAVLHGADAAIGSGQLAGALHDFEDHWQDGRKHLTGNARALGQMATQSVEAYRQADDRLAEAIRDSMRAPQGSPQGSPQ